MDTTHVIQELVTLPQVKWLVLKKKGFDEISPGVPGRSECKMDLEGETIKPACTEFI